VRAFQKSHVPRKGSGIPRIHGVRLYVLVAIIQMELLRLLTLCHASFLTQGAPINTNF
jgi:hypothetical protein